LYTYIYVTAADDDDDHQELLAGWLLAGLA
jgi:hypothetical protein